MRTCMRPQLCLQFQSDLRTYSSSKVKRPSRFDSKKKTMSLDDFLQRSRTIALYRNIVRGCRKIPDPTTKKEMLKFAKEEFQRNSEVTDPVRSTDSGGIGDES
ncbi:Uncharacterized protein BP5553_09965 [Venustampulla echinocandica]|uniref:Complex 1 LYR protein domain-containing protein n=1 Tax=Venustampulla echinocandica TaxID=2656787 RepID=A0A370TB56_9HELO|nr:Uncharacterized protein BP5553_09965 [Venustampulla echinocandica]RDL31176.1 Uncharacterized protein BP5553_09965 [Venustampulla echinocandica]